MDDDPAATPVASPDPEPVELELLTVTPAGHMAGRTLHMRYPSVGFLIAQRRGEADDERYWAEVVDAIEDHDLGRDPDRLPAREVGLIGRAWIAAMKERAVPPA